MEYPLSPDGKEPAAEAEKNTAEQAVNLNTLTREELLEQIAVRERIINSLNGQPLPLHLSDARSLDPDHFRQAFFISPVAASVTTIEGVMTPNPAFGRLLGYDIYEMATMNWREVSFPEDVAKSQEHVRKLLETDINSTVFEKRYFHRNGNVIWVEIAISLLRSSEGKPLMFLSIIHDITERIKAHDQLLINRERLNQAVKIAGLGIWEWTIQDDRLTISGDMFRHLGVTTESFSGKGIDYPFLIGSFLAYSSSLNDFDRGEVYQRKADIMMRENGREVETINSEGKTVILQISSSLLYASDGKPEKVLGVCSDVTDSRKIEEERKQRERMLLETQRMGKVGSLKINFRDNTWSASPNMDAMLGLIGTEVKDRALFKKLMGDEEFNIMLQRINAAAERKEKSFDTEFLIHRFDDNKPIWFHTQGEISYTSENKLMLLTAFVRDITEEKAHLQRLMSLQEKFSAAFYTSPNAISITRVKDGSFVEVNPMFTKLSGYKLEEIKSTTSVKLNIWKSSADRDKILTILKQQGIVLDFEAEFVRKDKSVFTGLMSASILQINNETCVLSITRDISERKQMENELLIAKENAEQSNRLKSAFLTNMSHELRTPMIGILGYSEMLSESSEEPEVKKAATVIYRSGKRLLNTLNLLFDISRLEAGTVLKHEHNFDAVELLREMAKEHEERATDKGLKLTLVSPLTDVCLYSDRSILQSIVENILDNAIKYTNHGEIRIFVNRKFIDNEVQAVLRISDSGIGIRPEDMDKIWMEFRQASEGIGRRYEGVGLGLSITKRMVQLLNGKIVLESEYGVGTVVTVTIPGVVL